MDLQDPVAHRAEVAVEVPTQITCTGVWEKLVVAMCLHHPTDEKVATFSFIAFCTAVINKHLLGKTNLITDDKKE